MKFIYESASMYVLVYVWAVRPMNAGEELVMFVGSLMLVKQPANSLTKLTFHCSSLFLSFIYLHRS